MARILPNAKGFKIIELTKEELFSIGGGLSICDICCAKMDKGFYIPVLNSTYCQKDYERWNESAIRYAEDIPYELLKFKQMKQIFNIVGSF